MKKKEIKWHSAYLTGYTKGEIEYRDNVDKARKLRALSKVLRILGGE